jgi:hypothetical protein
LLVAIKVPKALDKDFIKELAVWKNLNHPNIVKLIGYDINPRPYMVMELMNGTLYGKTFDKDTATRIILDVLSGIARKYSTSTGVNPYVADAIVLSYVTNNNQFTVDTVSNYNNYDYTMNRDPGGMCLGNQNIGINVGDDTYLPLSFPRFMYEYGWTSGGPGYSSGYYVGILQYNDSIGYFLTTQYIQIIQIQVDIMIIIHDLDGGLGLTGRYLNYYFLEDNNGNTNGYSGSDYVAFMPPDQQNNQNYYQYGVFWLYNWFQAESNNMNIFFLMNGNICNYSLALEQYIWDSR